MIWTNQFLSYKVCWEKNVLVVAPHRFLHVPNSWESINLSYNFWPHQGIDHLLVPPCPPYYLVASTGFSLLIPFQFWQRVRPLPMRSLRETPTKRWKAHGQRFGSALSQHWCHDLPSLGTLALKQVEIRDTWNETFFSAAVTSGSPEAPTKDSNRWTCGLWGQPAECS